jgi:hypothetical protein
MSFYGWAGWGCFVGGLLVGGVLHILSEVQEGR